MTIIYNADGVAGKVCNKCGEWKPVSEFRLRRLHGELLGDGYKPRCKDCLNREERERRAANPEKYRKLSREYMAMRRDKSNEYQRSWRAANREKVKVALRTYRERNREKINMLARIRRATSLEHYRAIGRASLAKHREKRNAASREYARRHPGWRSAKVRARRAMKYHAEGSHTEAEWESLKAQYDYTCLRCSKHEPEITLTRDHVIPITKGGSDYIANIQPLCHSCNSAKNTQIIDYRTNWPIDPLTPETPADR